MSDGKKALMRIIMKYYKIWLPVLSVFLFFGTAELICRYFDLTDKFNADYKFYIHHVDNDLEAGYMAEDARLMWFPKPNYDDGDTHINSRGFRDKEYDIKKDRNVFRILCLGDSSTFGFNVRLEDTYHSLLEDRLNKQFSQSGIRYEVINAGVTGYSSYQGLYLYKLKGIRYAPDIVIFYLGLNDHKSNFYLSDRQIMQHDVPSTIKAALENNFLLNLQSYRLLRKLIVNIFDSHKIRNRKNVRRVSAEDFKENILALNGLCRKNGSMLLLISPPVNKEEVIRLNLITEINTFRKQLDSISENYHIPLISIPEMTEASGDDTSKFFADSLHPNKTGHQRIMESLYNYLLTNKLLPQK